MSPSLLSPSFLFPLLSHCRYTYPLLVCLLTLTLCLPQGISKTHMQLPVCLGRKGSVGMTLSPWTAHAVASTFHMCKQAGRGRDSHLRPHHTAGGLLLSPSVAIVFPRHAADPTSELAVQHPFLTHHQATEPCSSRQVSGRTRVHTHKRVNVDMQVCASLAVWGPHPGGQPLEKGPPRRCGEGSLQTQEEPWKPGVLSGKDDAVSPVRRGRDGRQCVPETCWPWCAQSEGLGAGQ